MSPPSRDLGPRRLCGSSNKQPHSFLQPAITGQTCEGSAGSCICFRTVAALKSRAACAACVQAAPAALLFYLYK
eukprot:2439372-Rhodomonas_salina.1